MEPVLFKVRDALCKHGHIQVLNLLWLVADGHLIEDDTKGPHVDSWCDPGLITHFRCLVILRANQPFHEGHLLGRINNVAQAKVTNLCNWALLFVFLLNLMLNSVIGMALILLEDEYIVNLDVSVNDTSLVHVPEALEHVLGPDHQFLILDWFVLTKDSAAQVVRSKASVLHEDTKVLVSLHIVESMDNVWVVHLSVDGTLTPCKSESKIGAADFLLLSCL